MGFNLLATILTFTFFIWNYFHMFHRHLPRYHSHLTKFAISGLVLFGSLLMVLIIMR